VREWIKGSDADQIVIGQYAGADEFTGEITLPFADFLLGVGHEYVLLLGQIPPDSNGPNEVLQVGPGNFFPRFDGHGAFDVTDGYVHAVDSQLAPDLEARYGGMALDDFLVLLRGYVANPVPVPTLPPAPLPSPDESDTAANPVPTLGIDADINDGGGNAANAAPGRVTPHRCARLGEVFYVDVFTTNTLNLASSQIGPEPGITFDPAVIKIDDNSPNPMLVPFPAANGSAGDAGGARPSTTGDYFAAYFDFGAPDAGSGPLWRIPVEAVGLGTTTIKLSDAAAADRIVLGDADGHNAFSPSQTQVLDAVIDVKLVCLPVPLL
jgi:hypothetical protein